MLLVLLGFENIKQFSKTGIKHVFFFLWKREISLIQNNNTLHLNTKTKALKTLEDDTASKLIARINGIIGNPKMPRIPKIPHLMKHTDEEGFYMTFMSDQNSFVNRPHES